MYSLILKTNLFKLLNSFLTLISSKIAEGPRLSPCVKRFSTYCIIIGTDLSLLRLRPLYINARFLLLHETYPAFHDPCLNLIFQKGVMLCSEVRDDSVERHCNVSSDGRVDGVLQSSRSKVIEAVWK